MNLSHKATKEFIKSLPPKLARHYIEDFEIPTPFKEILIAVCIMRLRGFAITRYLQDEYNINIELWTVGRKLKEALEMFRKSYKEL